MVEGFGVGRYRGSLVNDRGALPPLLLLLLLTVLVLIVVVIVVIVVLQKSIPAKILQLVLHISNINDTLTDLWKN